MKRIRAVQIVSRGLVLMGAVTAVLAVSGFKSLSTGTRAAQLMTRDRYAPINIRVSPSTQSRPLHVGFSGDRIEVLRQQNSSDGFTWYQVRFEQTGAIGWVRGDLVKFNQGRTAQSVSSQPAIKVAQPINPQEIAIVPQPISRTSDRTTVTQQQINYFLEIALGSEFDQNSNPTLHKWSGEVRIQPKGNPTSADLATLQTVINEVNGLTNGNIRLQLVTSNPNLTIHFVPESQFKRLEPGYVPVNYGFFMTRWDTDGTIRGANVLINSENITQKERSHLIREELTQSLGLMQDSYKYADSMFYQPWTDTNQYSALDRALIQLLYSPDLRAGMTRAQVMTILNGYQAQEKPPLRF